jgi:hypothetical protein
MAIRFQCGSCSQPIEVDDEWASKLVACPYCRKTVAAPAESALDDLSRIPAASPVAGASPVAAVSPATTYAPIQPDVSAAAPPNHIATVALVLVILSAGFLVAWHVVLSQHQAELDPLVEAMSAGFAGISKAQADFIDAHGGKLPGWYVAAIILQTVSGLTWIAAIVCGVIGVRRVRRRGLAVTSLVVAGGMTLYVCCGGLVGLGA